MDPARYFSNSTHGNNTNALRVMASSKKGVTYGALQVNQCLFTATLSPLFVVVLLKGVDGRISAQVWATSVLAIIALLLLKRDDLPSFSSFATKSYQVGVNVWCTLNPAH